ncbi:MAG TPA: alkaline phosphatase family protein, partial [Thermoplasmata archaeon]|nr:alkaline phosphatase family protein [Thermoplasmata archaeon]
MPATPPIEHVVILVKENHTFDNYFGTFPGADGIVLPHASNPPTTDFDHRHEAWLRRATGAARLQYGESDLPQYFAYARSFTLCDRYFS